MKTLTVLFAVLLGVGSAAANTINVQNSSFEDMTGVTLTYNCGPGTPGCAWSNASIPDWTITNQTAATGLLQPGSPATTAFFSTTPWGPTIAYTNGGIISQTVGQVQAANVLYVLQVEVGRRADTNGYNPVGSYTMAQTGYVNLVIGNSTIAATGGLAPLGGWTTFTATYTSQAADIGKSLTIQLGAAANQGDFDNVQMNYYNPTPEPGTAWLAVLGLGGLVPVIRRKRHPRG